MKDACLADQATCDAYASAPGIDSALIAMGAAFGVLGLALMLWRSEP